MQFVWRFNVKRVSWTVHLDWCSLSHVITPLHAQCQQLYKTCPGLILITCNYGLPLNQRGVKPRTHQPVFHSRLHGLPQLRNFHIGSKCINIFKETASAVWEDTSVSQLLALRPHRRGHSRMQQNAAEYRILWLVASLATSGWVLARARSNRLPIIVSEFLTVHYSI